MLIRVDSSDPRPIYAQIVDEVRRALVLGTLLPDTPLPSVRQLAVTLRVNPNTVAQAYRELEHLGLAYVRRGQGTFAASSPPPDQDRASLARDIAAHALDEAQRIGLSIDELIDTIRTVSSTRDEDSRA